MLLLGLFFGRASVSQSLASWALLCLLTEMTVVCLERGHSLPPLGPSTSLFGIPQCAEQGIFKVLKARKEVAELNCFVLNSSGCVRTVDDE